MEECHRLSALFLALLSVVNTVIFKYSQSVVKYFLQTNEFKESFDILVKIALLTDESWVRIYCRYNMSVPMSVH